MNLGEPLIAYAQPTELMEPGDRALDDPAGLAEAALTFGNVEIYGAGADPTEYGAYGDPNVNIGRHEEAHTLQGQVLGIFFGPAYLLAGPFGDPRNPFERAGQEYGAGRGSWWPW